MTLTLLDWLVIAAYFALNLAIGLYYARRARGSTARVLSLGPRRPLVAGRHVDGRHDLCRRHAAARHRPRRENGIAGNWLWWNMVVSGMLTVFFYARLWRRAGVMTDIEFAEIRYAGRPAAFLRGFRALYLGLPINCIVIGWVNLAMMKILAGDARARRDARARGHCWRCWRSRRSTRHRRTLGRAGHRSLSVRAEDGNGHRAGRILRCTPSADRGARGEDARARCGGRQRLAARFLSGGRFGMDAGDHPVRLSRRELVGELVSGRRAGRRRLRRAADFLGARRAPRACSRRSGSTSRTTRCGRGRGF